MMTHKVLDINHSGYHIVCIYLGYPDEFNPYRIYQITYDGSRFHRKQIAKYANFQSVMQFLTQAVRWFH